MFPLGEHERNEFTTSAIPRSIQASISRNLVRRHICGFNMKNVCYDSLHNFHVKFLAKYECFTL